MNEDRLFRALERIEARQHEHTERLVAVETKVDDIKAEGAQRDVMLADHDKAITGMRTIVKAAGTLGTIGGAAGVWGMFKGFFTGAQ